MKTITIAAVSALALSLFAGCADDERNTNAEPNPEPPACEADDCNDDDGEGGAGGGAGGAGGASVGGMGAGGEMPEPPPPAPTCNDGAQNADETDVDCGGSCGPCNIGEQCAQPNDCASGACTDNVCNAVASCKQARDAGATQDGVYTILLGGGSPQDVYCDMTTDGGGWTLLSVVRDDDGTNKVPIVADAFCTSPDPNLACKGKMPPELVSADTEVRVEDIASGDYIIYGGFSASPSSFLRYLSLELDLIDDGVGSDIAADPNLAVVASHGLAFALAGTQLRQWILHGGWYVRADGVSGDVRISTTAYTSHDNKMLEHDIAGAGGTIVHEGHQVLYYR